MTSQQKAELRIALQTAFAEAIDTVGLHALKASSLFGSNDVAYKAAHPKRAA